MSNEVMNVENVCTGLTKALDLKYTSVLAYSVAASGVASLEHRGLAKDLWAFAQDELNDVQVLVEKLTALGGRPSEGKARSLWDDDNDKWLRRIIEHEVETIEALHAVIPDTGQEGRSEALEHVLEHAIMRKQRQVDLLSRSLGIRA